MRAFSAVLFALLASLALSVDCYQRIDRSRAPTNKYIVTYDLSGLVYDSQYVVRDKDLVARNYTYWFNICKGVKDPPVYGNTQTMCANQTDGTFYPAYQVASGGTCYHLGGGVTNQFMRFEPIDYDDPSTGVTLVYTGGDGTYCGTRQRSFRLSFYCMNNPTNLPTDSDIVEYPACTYNIRLESMFGCPVSCGEYQRVLCGGNGVCGYDRDRQAARCFCNDGYYGTACENQGTEAASLDSTSTILLCVSVFLLIVEIGVLIMWNKVKGLRLDPAAYANLNKESMGMVSNI